MKCVDLLLMELSPHKLTAVVERLPHYEVELRCFTWEVLGQLATKIAFTLNQLALCSIAI